MGPENALRPYGAVWREMTESSFFSAVKIEKVKGSQKILSVI